MMKGVAVLTIVILCFCSITLNAQIFTERAEDFKIDHFTSDPNAMGGGVAIFDFNNDGFEDIYLTGGLEDDKLFENLGNGSFRDVTKKMRITQFNGIKTMGVVAGDVDNDGFTDLFITTAENSRCYLLKNLEGKFFSDISLAAGINHQSWSMSATMADYDLDGDLDIYVGNYVDFDALPFDQNIDRPLPDFFYENNGNATFTKIDNPINSENEGCTLATSFSDIDQDGDSDLFVLNDFGDFYIPNKLLLNNYPASSFDDISDFSGVNAAINSMGVAVGDFNEDGYFDYYVTNIGNNILLQNSGSNQFSNVAFDRKVNDGTGVCWGTAFLDVNNDGHLDLYASKGSLLNLNDSQNNLLYIGFGDQESFLDASGLLATDQPNKARGMAYGDLNNDGQLDIIAVNIRLGPENRGKTKLYMNSGNEDANWIKVALEGTDNNRSAYGAIVKAYTNGKEQIREVSGGSSYLSVHSKMVHMGLGNAEKIDSLVVQWPRGKKREVFKDLEPNSTYSILEGDTIYERLSETVVICEGENVTINGSVQTEEGVYRQVTDKGEGDINVLRLTKLVVKDTESSDCDSVVIPKEEELSELQMSVFPSPFENKINIAHGDSFDEQVQVLLSDISGVIVQKKIINAKNTSGQIKLSGYENLPSGIYLLVIVSNGKTYSRKIIKS
ncbi:T9SS type A sorting domain-containing protein [Aggregatimonas sangjinii]|uniref:T9SS type A sorting domain-containing protein n=1 Tax=Aggregatimonas sangjinii TaxID=2583587 RepID=A0A5B7SLN2_9FLAO|nr:FG-GAP-like repeat-containing protein [Aggregatimonas sangjinii]QCW99485.1 T9SS type A sorting domain-containing protein [Aggregatimonas sangjinii]